MDGKVIGAGGEPTGGSLLGQRGEDSHMWGEWGDYTACPLGLCGATLPCREGYIIRESRPAGFIFGFALGAETLQALFGIGFLATVTSWAVGFVIGAVFAVLSYLFWTVAVALWSASIGYALGAGLMGLIGLDSGVIPWLVGVAAGVALAAVVIMFNLQKWIVIIGTALIGSGAVLGTLLVVLGVVPKVLAGPAAVRLGMQNSPFWLISYVVLFAVGFAAQYRNTREWKLTPAPDRW